MTARYIISRILSEMKNMARSARIEATSGWVTSLFRSGDRCRVRVRPIPKAVVRKVRRGFANDAGRRRGRRAA
jgi:hypothetical protein